MNLIADCVLCASFIHQRSLTIKNTSHPLFSRCYCSICQLLLLLAASLCPLIPFFRTVHYNDLSNRTQTFNAQLASNEHQKKMTLLMYFAEYMDTHLIAGGQVPLNGASISSLANSTTTTTTTTTSEQQPAKDEHSTAIFMKKWFRTDRAIIMYLTSGTLQARSSIVLFTFIKLSFVSRTLLADSIVDTFHMSVCELLRTCAHSRLQIINFLLR